MKKTTLLILAILASYCFSMGQSNPSIPPAALEKLINTWRENTLGLPIGDKFPEFEFVDLEGNKTDYKDLKDKLIILNTWFVGCTGCKEEEENLKQLTEEFKDREDIVFLSFAMSSPQKIERYFSKRGDFGYQTARVDREWVNDTLKITLSPTHYIIKDGILVEQITMPISETFFLDWYRNRILEFLAEA
ncbi:TlpA family protein disulfide reductase [Algoriphagus sp. NG3]|uniref:TlpA family protein disulfide reductase n=1 Tax=unclassified Algoriphagus TaxID=2641541 RepID=UPI002A82E413|nr:redoxin domain-containing protein [Algoriphagus sp. NG3]WPR74394.1 redoxin domain-containing protein [Algoriphagus sp. NG3]